jgi:LmbE family N-acetylglucosaminyl deacetylase
MTDGLATPARALAIGSHPDDIEFGCGATLARWAAAGCVVHLLVLTDGSKGSWDPDADPNALVATRVVEQRAAAKALGAHDVHFGPAIDGELVVDRDGTEAVCGVIRVVRPDVILGHDPWKRYRLHPDHRNAGWLTLDAIVAARDPHFFPEQELAPHRPSALLLFEADEIDHWEAATETTLQTKIDALLAHQSQWRSTHGIDQDPERETAAFAARVRRDTTAPDGSLAEPFKLITRL